MDAIAACSIDVQEREVTLFVTGDCDLCPLVRYWLRGHHVRFVEVDIGADREAHARLRRLAGSPAVPSVQLPGGELIIEPSPADLAAFLARRAA